MTHRAKKGSNGEYVPLIAALTKRICFSMANIMLPEIVKSFGKGDEPKFKNRYFNTLKNRKSWKCCWKFLFLVVFLWLRYCLATDMMLLVFLISLSPASILFLLMDKKPQYTPTVNKLLSRKNKIRCVPSQRDFDSERKDKKSVIKKSWDSSSSEEVKWMKSPHWSFINFFTQQRNSFYASNVHYFFLTLFVLLLFTVVRKHKKCQLVFGWLRSHIGNIKRNFFEEMLKIWML